MLEIVDKFLKLKMTDKFSDLVTSDAILFEHPDICLRARAEQCKQGGTAEFPFLSYYRMTDNLAPERAKAVIGQQGILKGIHSAKHDKYDGLKAAPVDSIYEAHFYAHTKREANNFQRIWFMWKYNEPNLNYKESDIGIESDYEWNFIVRFGNCDDMSPLDRKYEIGLLYHFRIDFTVENWAVLSTTVPSIKKVIINAYDFSASAEQEQLKYFTIEEGEDA